MNLTEEELANLKNEYCEVADKINALLNEIKLVYPNAPKQLNDLIGKYVQLHIKIYT